MTTRLWQSHQHFDFTQRRIQVWGFETETESFCSQSLEAYLSSEELARAHKLVSRTLTDKFIIAHGILRLLLGQALQMAPNAINFQHGEHGKPSISGDPIHFNISHSGNHCVIVISPEGECGIDIESGRSNIDLLAITQRFFSKTESTTIASLPESARLDAFYSCWVLKEAYLKSVGSGLTVPLKEVEVDLAATHPVIARVGSQLDRVFISELLPKFSNSHCGLVYFGEDLPVDLWRLNSTHLINML